MLVVYTSSSAQAWDVHWWELYSKSSRGTTAVKALKGDEKDSSIGDDEIQKDERRIPLHHAESSYTNPNGRNWSEVSDNEAALGRPSRTYIGPELIFQFGYQARNEWWAVPSANPIRRNASRTLQEHHGRYGLSEYQPNKVVEPWYGVHET